MRPHEALGMQTPASVWTRSSRNYDPHPPRWEYPAGAVVKRITQHGRLVVNGKHYELRALAGEWIQLLAIEDRVLVYYCNTVVREIDLESRRSVSVERWLPS